MSKVDKKPKQKKPEASSDVTLQDLPADSQVRRIAEVKIIMNEREEARKAKNFEKSDFLRDKLKNMGVEVIDQKNGPSGFKFTDGSSNKLPAGTKIPDAAKKRKREEPAEDNKVEVASSLAPGAVSKKKKKGATAEQNRNLALLNAALPASQGNVVQGIQIDDKVIGTGAVAERGKRLKMQYVGKLKTTGKVFDASKKPFAFTLGRGEVIAGWEIGIRGMRVGGKRTLVIPPEKAYGRHGAPPVIPGNATLVFDVTLVDVK